MGMVQAPSVSNLEANFPIKRPGRQDNCSSAVTLDSAGVRNRGAGSPLVLYRDGTSQNPKLCTLYLHIITLRLI